MTRHSPVKYFNHMCILELVHNFEWDPVFSGLRDFYSSFTTTCQTMFGLYSNICADKVEFEYRIWWSLNFLFCSVKQSSFRFLAKELEE